MIRAIQWQAMIREGGQLLAADQLGILIRSVVERASDIRFADAVVSTGTSIPFDGRLLGPYASNRQASICCSGVEDSSKVLRATRPPGL